MKLDNEQRAEVLKMIADAKKELRKEIGVRSNDNFTDKSGMKQSTSDNTDAILELAELIGG